VDQFKVPALDRDRILRDNAIRLFKLDARALRASAT
jgi:predicted TIM-barrel fold metal-dependent hydrolase